MIGGVNADRVLRAKFREKSCVSVLSGIKNFGNSRCACRAKKNATCDFCLQVA